MLLVVAYVHVFCLPVPPPVLHCADDSKDIENPDDVLWDACFVLQVENTASNLTFLRQRILKGLVKADLRFGLVYAQDRKSVFCKVYATNKRCVGKSLQRVVATKWWWWWWW